MPGSICGGRPHHPPHVITCHEISDQLQVCPLLFRIRLVLGFRVTKRQSGPTSIGIERSQEPSRAELGFDRKATDRFGGPCGTTFATGSLAHRSGTGKGACAKNTLRDGAPCSGGTLRDLTAKAASHAISRHLVDVSVTDSDRRQPQRALIRTLRNDTRPVCNCRPMNPESGSTFTDLPRYASVFV
jgi:hypothetical protein